jgi:hemerythrin-like metal-binding protein
VIDLLSAPLVLKNSADVRVGASIGVAVYPQCGREIDRLMNAADRAMYESKSRGKNTFTFTPAAGGKGTADAPAICLDAAHVVGAPLIDEQHQVIADKLNKFNLAVQSLAAPEVVVGLFDEMIAFVGMHFGTEERLMAALEYPERVVHASSHRHLLEKARHLRAKLAEGGEMLALQALKDWFLPHILNFDKPLADYLSRSPAPASHQPAGGAQLTAANGPP